MEVDNSSEDEKIVYESLEQLDGYMVGFGKHTNLTFKSLAETQKQYCTWLFNQSWFEKERSELYYYLTRRGICMSTSCVENPNFTQFSNQNPNFTQFSNQTKNLTHLPNQTKNLTHNQLQALFTDEKHINNLVNLYTLKSKMGYNAESTIKNVKFEDDCNADLVIYFSVYVPEYIRQTFQEKYEIIGGFINFVLLVEIKPTISNEYPDILRQMRSQKRAYKYYNSEKIKRKKLHIKQILVYQIYTGDVEIEKVREIFGNILLNEFRS